MRDRYGNCHHRSSSNESDRMSYCCSSESRASSCSPQTPISFDRRASRRIHSLDNKLLRPSTHLSPKRQHPHLSVLPRRFMSSPLTLLTSPPVHQRLFNSQSTYSPLDAVQPYQDERLSPEAPPSPSTIDKANNHSSSFPSRPSTPFSPK